MPATPQGAHAASSDTAKILEAKKTVHSMGANLDLSLIQPTLWQEIQEAAKRVTNSAKRAPMTMPSKEVPAARKRRRTRAA